MGQVFIADAELLPQDNTTVVEYVGPEVGPLGDQVTKLKTEIIELWLHGRDRRIVLGKKLKKLRELIGNQGNGAFLKTVSSQPPNGLGIPVPTAYCFIGDYAQAANFDTFVHHKKAGREIRNDLASLVGVRFLSAEESGEDHRLDESLIKSLTGENAVRTRFLYQEEFTYYPNFKIWMSSNFCPSIRSTDWGTWRRVKLIPWEVVVPKGRRDEQLKAKLRAEASGILNWMLCGLADYLKNGMEYPQKVEVATICCLQELGGLCSGISDAGAEVLGSS